TPLMMTRRRRRLQRRRRRIWLWPTLLLHHVPSSEEIELFETDESAATLPPPTYRATARMFIRAHAPIQFPFKAEVDKLLAIPTPPPSPLLP
ncbi:hypothetical protein Tco_0555068, partial [Tanacetum coccineum]